jgi:hypothetical protein
MVRRTNMWHYFYARYGNLSQRDNFERCLAAMLRYKRLRPLKPDPDRIRREFRQGEPTYGRLFALFHEHQAERVGKPRWGDKSLLTERHVDHILVDFPNAKFIHMVRDPRDRYASVYKRYSVNRGKVGVATGKWLYSARLATRNLRRYPDRYMPVRYEALVSQPEATLREVCAFIDEPYVPAMLTMEGAPDHRDKGGNSSFGRLEPGAISTRSIGRFRQVLSKSDIAFMQRQAGQTMVALGYSLDPIHFSFTEWLHFTVVDWPANLARMAAWTAREAAQDRKGRSLPSYRIISEAEVTGARAGA